MRTHVSFPSAGLKLAGHVGLYDKPEYVNPAVEKLTGFFKKLGT